MHANNEVGTIQPIAEIARLIKPAGVPLHTDAAQSAGKVELDVEALGVDLLALADHKLYATKGIGALYVRARTPIKPILFGADQERGGLVANCRQWLKAEKCRQRSFADCHRRIAQVDGC